MRVYVVYQLGYAGNNVLEILKGLIIKKYSIEKTKVVMEV